MTDGMHVCKHNQNIMCQERNCGHCGWNPVISENRLDAFRKKHGIKKKKTNERLINAVDIEARIRTCVEPLAEKGYSTWRILAEVIKCIHTSKTIIAEETKCFECIYSRQPVNIRGSEDHLICGMSQSPCYRRRVNQEDYCRYAEKKG